MTCTWHIRTLCSDRYTMPGFIVSISFQTCDSRLTSVNSIHNVGKLPLKKARFLPIFTNQIQCTTYLFKARAYIKKLSSEGGVNQELKAKRATARGLAFECQIRALVKISFWTSEIILLWVFFEIGYCFSFYFLHIINWHVGVQLLVLISVKPPKLRSWICKKLGSAESAVSESCMRGHALSIISYWVLSRHEIAHDSGCHPPW